MSTRLVREFLDAAEKARACGWGDIQDHDRSARAITSLWIDLAEKAQALGLNLVAFLPEQPSKAFGAVAADALVRAALCLDAQGVRRVLSRDTAYAALDLAKEVVARACDAVLRTTPPRRAAPASPS